MLNNFQIQKVFYYTFKQQRIEIILTQYSGKIVGPIARLLSYIMEEIFVLLDKIGIPSIGLAIILFTVGIYLLLMPLTIKQQKFARLSAKMNPELQAIQAKYKGRTDHNSILSMQTETKAVYAKYCISPLPSFLPMLIQMPILLALYRVIYNASTTEWMNISGNIFGGLTIGNSPVHIMQTAVTSRSFLLMLAAASIPVLSAATQWINVKMMSRLTKQESRNSGGRQTGMPPLAKIVSLIPIVISAFFCCTLPAGMGLYWITGSVVKSIQQIIISRYIDKMDLDEVIKKNEEKARKKMRKTNTGNEKIAVYANMNTKNIPGIPESRS